MIAVYPAKRRGLPARCCQSCQTTKGKMLEIKAGHIQNTITIVLCKPCADITAQQIKRGGIRRPSRTPKRLSLARG